MDVLGKILEANKTGGKTGGFSGASRSNIEALLQCFGSRSGSMKIRIEMAPLDPDPDLYWEYGLRSGSQTVKMVSKKEDKTLILR